MLAAYVAAAVHDYRHAGVSNRFLVETASPTAIVYNDTSPQENLHAASAFKLLLDDRHNFLKDGLDAAEARTFRSRVISMVLHTDMQQHFPLLTRFKARVGQGCGEHSAGGGGGRSTTTWSTNDEQDATLVLQIALKAADLSHLAYDFGMHNEWVDRLQEEMFRQGDLERTMGLPESALCDRKKPGVSEAQADFIDFVAVGLFKALAAAFPATRQMLAKVVENRDIWILTSKKGA